MSRPLERLVQSEEEIEEDILASTLEPYVSFTQSGETLPTSNFSSLQTKEKILAILLAFKALALLNKRNEPGAGPLEIAEVTGIAHGTVRRSVRELQAANLLRSDKGSYFVPAFSMPEVTEMLGANGD